MGLDLASSKTRAYMFKPSSSQPLEITVLYALPTVHFTSLNKGKGK